MQRPWETVRNANLGLTVMVVLLAIGARAATAQQRPDPAGPGTIVGVVVDQFGRGLDSAEVYIAELKVHKLVGADGRFRFDSIGDGRYTVVARHIGYFAGGRVVTMVPEGVVAAFRLAPIVRSLPTVVKSATRGGLSGVIGDTAYKVIEGAHIELVGESRRAESDSAGMFFIKVPVGKHMVTVKKEGYATKMVSVSVPSDSGRQILVQLSPSIGENEYRLNAGIDQLHDRLLRRSAGSSMIMTREDINKSGLKDLYDLAIKGAMHSLREDCPAILDGGPRAVPLYSLKAADIDMIEVYTAKRQRNTYNNVRANGGKLGSMRIPDCEAVYVWLRK